MRWFVGVALLVLLCSNAHAKSKPARKFHPHFHSFRSTPEGALLKVRNPLKKPVLIRLVCTDAFGVQWIELPARSDRSLQITAGEPIKGPCTLKWKAVH